MRSHSLYDKVEDLLSHLVIRPVFVSPSQAIFETHTQADADQCIALIPDHPAYSTSLADHHFLVVSLKPTSVN